MDEQKKEILLVEDDRVDAEQVKRLLNDISSEPLDICWTQTLAECIAHLDQTLFDVVILDLSLPDSQGLETFTQIYKQIPDIPIIILTGLDDEAVGAKAVGEGAQDYLVKGTFDAQTLIRSTQYAIERKRAEIALREAERLRVLVETAGAAAHEINQPLQGIAGGADLLLQRTDLDEEMIEYVKMIRNSCDRVIEIVKQMSNIQQYATKAYVLGYKIVDFDQSAEQRDDDKNPLMGK